MGGEAARYAPRKVGWIRLDSQSTHIASVNAHPVFIVGCDRSGTTLLAALLDRHSQIAVPPETHFFRNTCPTNHDVSTSQTHAELLTSFYANQRAHDMRLDADALAKRFSQLQPTYGNLFLAAMDEYAQARGKRRVVEKSPGHLARIPMIMEMFPEAKVICVVRDGRDVARSLVQVAWSHSDLHRHAFRWNRSSRHVLRYTQAYVGRVCKIYFEDLLRDPEKVLRNLCDFIGECFEPQQIDSSTPTEVVPEYEKPWKQKAQQPIDVTRALAWRNQIDDNDKYLMNSIMGRHLRIFGYPNTTMTGCPTSRRISLWLSNNWRRLKHKK